MELSTILSHQWLPVLGLLFLLSSVATLALNKRQRDAVLERLHVQRRRASGASTPPRSFSPNKLAPTDNKEPPTPDYTNTFPPSRRCALPELAKAASSSSKNILLANEPTPDLLLKAPLPINQPYDLKTDVPKYTPTGFSTEELKAIGDFPAYDILSGVPLPQPYSNFDPTKALPRPYRPFRWAYHQTMCEFDVAFL
jgi:hypothetical protein